MGKLELTKDLWLKVPHEWGCDPLSAAIEESTGRARRSFSLHKVAVDRLNRLDIAIAMSVYRHPPTGDFEPATVLAWRVHPTFRSTVQLAMEGRLFEAAQLTRSVIECAAYSLHVRANPAAARAWSARRLDDEEGRFSVKSISTSVDAHAPRARDLFKHVYEDSIAFGAHPNVGGVISGTEAYSTPTGLAAGAMSATDDASEIAQCLGRAEMSGILAVRLLHRRNDPYTDPRATALIDDCDSAFEKDPIGTRRASTGTQIQGKPGRPITR